MPSPLVRPFAQILVFSDDPSSRLQLISTFCTGCFAIGESARTRMINSSPGKGRCATYARSSKSSRMISDIETVPDAVPTRYRRRYHGSLDRTFSTNPFVGMANLYSRLPALRVILESADALTVPSGSNISSATELVVLVGVLMVR